MQQQHHAEVRAQAFSSDGKRLASVGADGSARIWDVSTRGLLRVFRRDFLPNPNDIAWEPEAQRVAIAGDSNTILYDVETEEVTRFQHRILAGVAASALAPTGRKDNVRWVVMHGLPDIYDADGKYVASLAPPADEPKLSILRGLSVSADGRRAAITARDRGVVVWDLDAIDEPARLYELDGWTDTVALSPDGSRAYAWVRNKTNISESSVMEVDLSGAALPAKLVTPSSWGGGVQVAASDEHVAVVPGDVLVFEARSRAHAWTRGTQTNVTKRGLPIGKHSVAAFSPDGGALATGRLGGVIELFDAVTGRSQGSFGAEVRAPLSLSFAGTDQLVVKSADSVVVWSLRDGTVQHQSRATELVAVQGADQSETIKLLVGGYAPGCAAGERSVFLSEAGDLTVPEPATEPICLAQVTNIPVVDLFGDRAIVEYYDRASGAGLAIDNLKTRTRVRLKDSSRDIARAGLRFSTDGSRVVAGGIPTMFGMLSEEIPVWDAATGDKLGALSIELEGVGRSRGASLGDVDGDRAAVAMQNRLSLRSFPDDEPIADHELDSFITAVQWIPGTRELLVGTTGGQLLRVSGTEIVASSQASGGFVAWLAMSSRRDRVAAVCGDGALRVWRLSDLALLGTLVSFEDDEYVAASPGGYYAGTAEVADRIGWVFERPLERFGFDQFASSDDPAKVRADLSASRTPPAPQFRRPPRVELVGAPAVAASGRSAKIRVRYSSDARVDSVQAYVEGRPAAHELACKKAGEAELEIPLLAGLNTISVAAFDDRGMSSNLHATTAVSSAGRRPALWIVAVGVSRYPFLGDEFQLNYADDDARDVAAAFAALAGEGKTYTTAHSTVLVDSDATVEAIGSALAALSKMRPDDLAVVVLAGHGIKPGDDTDMVFLTGNASLTTASLEQHAVKWGDIADHLQAARGRVVLLLDACHAGHITQEHVVRNQDLAAGLVRDRRAGVVVLSAAKGRQQSYEPAGSRGLQKVGGQRSVGRDDVGNGLFSGAVLESLGSADTDRNSDGAIQLSELIDRVTETVDRDTRGLQTPWVARREMFGDFLLAPAPRRPR